MHLSLSTMPVSYKLVTIYLIRKKNMNLLFYFKLKEVSDKNIKMAESKWRKKSISLTMIV